MTHCVSVIQRADRVKQTIKVFANTPWPRSVWGHLHLVLHVSALIATTCLSCLQTQQFSLSVGSSGRPRPRGEAALTFHTAWNQRSSCQEEQGRNAPSPSPEMSSAALHETINLHPHGPSWALSQTPMSVWTMFLFTVQKVIACTSAALGESLKIHYVLVLGDGFLAWLQVCDGWLVETLLWYGFRFSGSLKAAVNLSSATERISWEQLEPSPGFDSVYLFKGAHAEFQNVLRKAQNSV